MTISVHTLSKSLKRYAVFKCSNIWEVIFVLNAALRMAKPVPKRHFRQNDFTNIAIFKKLHIFLISY